MLNPFRKNIFFFVLLTSAALVLLSSCNATKHVPKGKQLLRNNTITKNGKTVKDYRAYAIIKQVPNKKIGLPFTNVILWRPYLNLYNAGNPDKEKGFGHWLTKIGEPPTILDSTLTFSSAKQLGQYYFNQGYFLNEIEFDIDFVNRDSSQANVVYKIYSGPQYRIKSIEYIISSPAILELVRGVKGKSKIKSGMPFNTETLEEERSRLVTTLRNNGYYGFQESYVKYEADTSAGFHEVNIKLIVGDKRVILTDSVYYVEHLPYTIKNIYVDPNFNFSNSTSNSSDSSVYKGLTLLEANPKVYKSHYLESQVHFKDGEIYNERKVKETYSHVTGNRVFQIADISFEPVKGDTNNQVNAYINLQPFDKRTFSAEFEGTNTAGNYGIAGVLTWASRNIFKAGEILDFSIRGGLEAQVNVNDNNQVFNTNEIGFEVGINFPRFFLAGRLNQRVPKRMEPKSRVYTSFRYQSRVEFERSIFTVGLLYNWKESQTKTHQVNLLDVNFVRLPRIDDGYYNSLEFKTGFQDQLIMSTRYTFIYDDKKYTTDRFHRFLRGSIEPAGNLLALINSNGTFALNNETDQYLVLGVPFAQYIKLDLDFRNYINPSKDHQVVTRFFVGTTFNYGNSPEFPPFEKSFLAGGSNDMRGWTAYRLGPGNFNNHAYSGYSAVGPIKIITNLEYRFPIIQSFKGALFIDAGNIWIWNRDYSRTKYDAVERDLINNGVFKFDEFYKQIATNTGIGFRYDFGFFALRLDLGIKIWDPSEANERFVLPGTKWENITYNIALGYPF